MEAEVVEEEAELDKEVVASKVVTKVANRAARPADLGVEAVPAEVVVAAVDVAEPVLPAQMSRATTWIRKSSIRVSRFR